MNEQYSEVIDTLISEGKVSKLEVDGYLSAYFPELDRNYIVELLVHKLYESDCMGESLALIKQSSLENHPNFLYILACIYFSLDELGMAHNTFSKAAVNGYTRSYYWLGFIYQYGKGVNVDLEKAINFYSRGAHCGYLYCDMRARSLIFFSLEKISIFEKVKYKCFCIFIFFKALLISWKDANDERLAEIPNFFQKIKGTK